MLYERWRQIAQAQGREIALYDSGRDWTITFEHLDRLVNGPSAPSASICCPCGMTAEFIVEVLRAWRFGKIVCPLEAGQAPPAVPEPPPGIVHLKTTSATTGAPRLVAFTAEQLAADAWNIVRTMGLRPDWPNVAAISLAHSYGFSNFVLPLLLHGIPLALVETPLPELLRHTLEPLASVTLPAVPALWRSWHQAGVLSEKVRLAISAGAPLPLALEREIFTATGLKLHNFYGATECGGIAYDASTTPRSDAALAGAPLQNVALACDADGCLEVRSPAVAQTYWPEPSANLAQGRYRTTDSVDLIAGQVFLRGRLTDRINVAGRKVSPETIERIVLTHPAVRDCLVFGVPSDDAERAETIVACVAARAGTDRGDLKQFLLKQLPAWQVPREWWFVDDLSANARGKLPRAEWRRRYLEQTARGKSR
jgi:acyl-coenzyme A synthetase/AMP-(fatty) acid ligase